MQAIRNTISAAVAGIVSIARFLSVVAQILHDNIKSLPAVRKYSYQIFFKTPHKPTKTLKNKSKSK